VAVSKRTRYEVLRRDGHSCRYCGSTAADSPLTVDHVVPTALGGDDAPENLVAACRDCNAGKAASVPDSQLVDDVNEDATRWARAMRTAIDEALLIQEAQDEYIRSFLKVWEQFNPELDELPTDFDGIVNYWRRVGLPIEMVTEAVYIAWSKTHIPPRAVFRYTIGVVRNRIEDAQKRATELLDAEGGNGDS